MRDRRVLASALWVVLAFLVWNVRFDYGVRLSARSYLTSRALYLRGAAPPVEMASAMRAGVHASAGAATLLALPVLSVAVAVAAMRWRRFDGIPPSR